MPYLTNRHYFAAAALIVGAVTVAAALALNLPGAAAALTIGQTALAAITILVGPRASSESTTSAR